MFIKMRYNANNNNIKIEMRRRNGNEIIDIKC